MSIRKEALENQAFMQMKAIYDNRETVAREWKKQGKKVVGIMGYDVPEELLMAAGMQPYRIYGDPDGDLSQTDHYLEFSFPPAVRAQFEKVIDGANADIMDYLVISNSTDALVRIYYYIREMKQLEPERPIPELYFIDWLFTRFRMHQVRNEGTVEKFRKQLETWSGKTIIDEAILQAANICNRNRELLEKMSGLRREGRINGSEALVIITSSMYMEKEAHSELLETLLEDAASWETVTGKKVFVTGSAQEDIAFYELLESHGLQIVSEDHDYGDRHWNKQTDMELEPVKGIVDRYMLRSAGTKRAFVSERVDAVCKAVETCGARGLISYTHMYDDAPSWDFPEEKAALQQKGIPSLQLSGRKYKVEADEALIKLIEGFAGEIKEG